MVSAENVALVTRCFPTSGKKENKWSRTCCLRTGKTPNLDSISKEVTRQEGRNFGSFNRNFAGCIQVNFAVADMDHRKSGSHGANNTVLQSQN